MSWAISVMHEPEHAGTKGVENQANRFAAAFLMPADDIRSSSPAAAAWNELLILKSRWGVSIGALLMRSRTLRVMPETHLHPGRPLHEHARMADQ